MIRGEKIPICDFCGRIMKLDFFEHLRIYHKEVYEQKKMEFIERAFMVGLDISASRRAVEKLSGEDIDRELKIWKIVIPPGYKRAEPGARKDYMEKALIDARAKSLISLLSKRLKKYGFNDKKQKLARLLVDGYTTKTPRYCYNAEVIAVTAIMVTFEIHSQEISPLIIEKIITVDKSINLEKVFNGLNMIYHKILHDSRKGILTQAELEPIDKFYLDRIKWIGDVLLKRFAGEMTVVSRIAKSLEKSFVYVSRREIRTALKMLQEKKMITSEIRTAIAGYQYTLWIFPKFSQVKS